MAEHLWSVACSRVCVDKFTNQVSIHDVLEEMTIALAEPAPDFSTSPGFQHTFQVVSLWRRSDPEVPEQGRCRLRALAPRDPQSTESGESVLSLDTNERTRTIVTVGALPYRGAGTYYIVVEVRDGEEWKVVSRIPIELHVKEGAQPAEQKSAPEETSTSNRDASVTAE